MKQATPKPTQNIVISIFIESGHHFYSIQVRN